MANVDVPEALQGSFKRVARRIPVELKKDPELMNTVVTFLTLGGERLARQAVEALKLTVDLEKTGKRRKARYEALVRAAEARLAALLAEAQAAQKAREAQAAPPATEKGDEQAGTEAGS